MEPLIAIFVLIIAIYFNWKLEIRRFSIPVEISKDLDEFADQMKNRAKKEGALCVQI